MRISKKIKRSHEKIIKAILLLFWAVLLVPLALLTFHRIDSYYPIKILPYFAKTQILVSGPIIIEPNITYTFNTSENITITTVDMKILFTESCTDTILQLEFLEYDKDSWNINISLEAYTEQHETIDLPLQQFNFRIMDWQNKGLLPIKEVRARISGENNHCKKIVIDKIIYSHKMEDIAVVWSPKISLLGYRNEYPEAKPDKTYRLVILGDSMTYGASICSTISYAETFTAQLEKKLQDSGMGTNVEVLNFGLPGANTEQEVDVYYENASKYGADLVLVYFYVNDPEDNKKLQEIMDNLSRTDKFKYLQEYQHPNDPDFYWQTIYWESRTIYFNSIFGDKITDNPHEKIGMNSTIDQFKRLKYQLDKTNTSFAIVTFYDTDHFQQNAIREYTLNNKIPLLELNPLLHKFGPKKIYICPDMNPPDSHPSAFAHKIIAENTFTFLNENNLVPKKPEVQKKLTI